MIRPLTWLSLLLFGTGFTGSVLSQESADIVAMIDREIERLVGGTVPEAKAAQQRLVGYGQSIRPILERRLAAVSREEESDLHHRLQQTLTDLSWGLGSRISRRIGESLRGHEQLNFRDRIRQLEQLDRLFGRAFRPALRRSMEEDPHPEVQARARRLLASDLESEALRSAGPLLAAGKFEEAVRLYDPVLAFDPGFWRTRYNLACLYSRWGKVDRALEELEGSILAGYADFHHMEGDTDLDPLRGEARFIALKKRYAKR